MKKFLNIQHKTLEEMGATTFKELWESAQKDGYGGIMMTMSIELTKSEAEEKTFHAVFSTSKEDRHGDIVHQEWDLKYFKKNPVLLDSHNYDSIEHILGRVKNIKSDGKLEGDIEFATENPKGKLAQYLAEKGFLNTTSVGFIPKEFNDKGEILKSELLEISVVSIPANPEALLEKKEEVIEEKIIKNEIAKISPTYKERVGKIVKQISDERRQELITLAKCVQELTEENRMSKKHEIHRIVRGLLRDR